MNKRPWQRHHHPSTLTCRKWKREALRLCQRRGRLCNIYAPRVGSRAGQRLQTQERKKPVERKVEDEEIRQGEHIRNSRSSPAGTPSTIQFALITIRAEVSPHSGSIPTLTIPSPLSPPTYTLSLPAFPRLETPIQAPNIPSE